MILIVGLGNPGRKFANTRHNIGFMVADEFLKENSFPSFKISKKFNSLISQAIFEGNEIILAKPQTFMNESGKAMKKLISNFKFLISNLWVVHDDLDLPLGKIKIVKDRGSAGHKGVQSIIDNLGTKNFIRFRIGIKSRRTYGLVRGYAGKKPSQSYGTVYRTKDWVLKKFTKEEKKILKEVIKKTVKVIEMALKEGAERAMSEFNS